MSCDRKRAAALLLALAMCLGLSACGGEAGSGDLTVEDASLYVDGLLKATYLGEYDEDYLTLVDQTEKDGEKAYQDCLEAEANYFLQVYGIEYPTQEYFEDLQELYAGIYSHAKFEVTSAAKQEDGSFSVKVTVEPIDVVEQVKSDLEEAVEDFYEKYPSDATNTMTDEEYQAMDEEWAQLILEVYQETLPDVGNLAAQTITVQIERDEVDGVYSMTKEDFKRLDQLIIDYGLD